ncbi:hypothetical protein BN2537_11963 [Streptomyces venezuelae]|nr:hypothetical protein BN2537_11963 [Streptomyces venezuelae]
MHGDLFSACRQDHADGSTHTDEPLHALQAGLSLRRRH